MAWTKVASLAEVKPGQPMGIALPDRGIVLSRIGDTIYAVNDRCPHKGAPLADGRIEGGFIVCALHGWKFHVETGQYPGAPSVKVRVFPVKVEEGDVWVDLPDLYA